MNTAIDILRVAVGLTFLCYASYSDLKTRRVKNEVWMAMGVCGGILLALQLFTERRGWEYFLIFIPITVLYSLMFFDFGSSSNEKEKRINLVPVFLCIIAFIAVIYQFYSLCGKTLFYRLLTIPLLIIIFYVFFQLKILHGGADAKAMMAIAILMPFYPRFFNLPLIQFSSERVAEAMELFFPFAFLVLMNSVLFVIWVFLAFFIINLTRKDMGFPEMLVGYKMDIDEIEKKFVWPMESSVDGERVLILFPKHTDKETLKKFKEMEIKRIWVTPKIPFIMFITVGFVISVFIGNVFTALMGAMG